MGIQTPKPNCQQSYQHPPSYTLFQDQPIEEKLDLEKSFEAFLESTRKFEISTDSSILQNFQIQDPYSMFQVPQQEKEPTELGMSMKNQIQFENDYTQSMNRLEAQMSCLINIVKERNKETLPNTFSIIPDCPNHIDRNEESESTP